MRRSALPCVTGCNATLDRVDASSEHQAPRRGEVVYRESLRTPPWWYLVALFVAALLAAEFHVSSVNLTDWIAFGTMLPLAVVIVWSLGRAQLEIAGGELRIRGAHIA